MFAATQPNELLTSDTARGLLSPSARGIIICEEDQHPWSRRWLPQLRHIPQGGALEGLCDSVLMRCFAWYSGSQPDAKSRMLARAPRMRLDTKELRRETLTTHIDHQSREDTPYISFTKSPSALEKLANRRAEKYDQQIVVINPRVRIELGLPVLSYQKEVDRYHVRTRYAVDYFTDHFLCLWEVRPEEVVGIFDWNDIRYEDDWFNTILRPKVQRHQLNWDNKRRNAAFRQPDISGTSIRLNSSNILGKSTWNVAEDSDSIASDSSNDVIDEDEDEDDKDDRNDFDDSEQRIHEEDLEEEILWKYSDLSLD